MDTTGTAPAVSGPMPHVAGVSMTARVSHIATSV